jgi:hypothetical protein
MASETAAPVVSAESLDAAGFDGLQLPDSPPQFVFNRNRMTNMIIRVLSKNFKSLVAMGTPIVLVEALIIEEILWNKAAEDIVAYEDMATMAARLKDAVNVRAGIIKEAKEHVIKKQPPAPQAESKPREHVTFEKDVTAKLQAKVLEKVEKETAQNAARINGRKKKATAAVIVKTLTEPAAPVIIEAPPPVITEVEGTAPQ